MKKTNLDTFAPHFWGGSSATSLLKIWDVMPHNPKTLFEQKQKINDFDHFCLDDLLKMPWFHTCK